MKATQVMTRAVTWVDPGLSVSEAWSLMEALRVRHLPVVDGGRLVGILSDRDLLRLGAPADDGGLTFPELTAGAAMTPSPTACLPNAQVSHLAAIMLRERIDCVPITQPGGSLVGIVTSADLLELLCASGPALQELPFSFTLRDAAQARARIA